MPDAKPILFILAGNMNEYEYIAREMFRYFGSKESCPYDVRYLNDEQKIRGHRDQYYYCYANWWRKPDRELAYIREIMRHSNFKELGHSDIFGSEDESVRGTVDYKDLNKVPTGFEFFEEEEFEI